MAAIRGQWGMFIIIFFLQYGFCTAYYEQSWNYTTLDDIFSLFFLAGGPCSSYHHNNDNTNDAGAERTIYTIEHSFIHFM